jgi:hypothetical protein
MARRPFEFERDASEVLDWLKILTRTATPFRELFSQAQEKDQAHIQIPDVLAKAYLHLLMSLAFASYDMRLFYDQIVLCDDLITLGMRKVTENLSQNRLSEYATFVPMELASMIAFLLIQDVTGPAIDIQETYIEYIRVLVSLLTPNLFPFLAPDNHIANEY